LNFYTSWADPCKQMNRVFDSLAAQFSPASLFISIDADEEPNISESFSVSAVPFFVLRRGTTVLEEISGSDPIRLSTSVAKHSGSLPPAQTATAPQSAESSGETDTVEDLNTRLGNLVKAAPVMLFMKGTPAYPECGFSKQLVKLLREKKVKFGFFNILADNEVRQGLKVFSDWPTFPQLYLQGELIGGLDIVKEEFETNPDFLKT